MWAHRHGALSRILLWYGDGSLYICSFSMRVLHKALTVDLPSTTLTPQYNWEIQTSSPHISRVLLLQFRVCWSLSYNWI